MKSLTISELYDRAVHQGDERIALKHGARTVSFRQLGSDALRLTGALQRLGLGKGDRLAFLMANCPEYVTCEYAVAKAGATRVPLATLLGEDDHVYMLNFARCRVLVYHEKFAARVANMAPRLQTVEHYIRIGGGLEALPRGHRSLDGLLQEGPDTPAPVDVEPGDIAGIYFTGGTTGRPKGVMLSHRAWFHTYYVQMLEFEIGWREVFVFTTPMTHAGGCLLLPVLLRQGCCVILDHFEPGLLLETIESERATATLIVPTMLYLLLDHPERRQRNLKSLANVFYGASAIAPERLRQALAEFGPVFTQFYGQTEAPMALTALPRAVHVAAEPDVLASAGWATYPTRIRLVDDEGRDVPRGEAGELIVQAPNVMSGYLDDPQATAEALRDGWLHTGDIARMTVDDLITIVDRKKDMIVSGGFNVYPREIEDVLFQHPAVRQAAVVGAPHEKWGEEVRALVVLHEGMHVGAEELIEFVKARKGSLAAPKAIDLTDAIPLTNLGKVDKKAIRAHYWSGRARQI